MTLASSAGWGHGPWGFHKGGFGEGPWATLVQTPGFPHTTEVEYQEDALRFADQSEQRVRFAVTPATRVTWEFPPNDPTWLADAASWFLMAGGRRDRFLVRDHYDAVEYVARFDADGMTRTRGPALRSQVGALAFRAERAITYRDEVLADQPLAYWPLAEPVGVHSVTDLVGSMHLAVANSGITGGASGPLVTLVGSSAAFGFVDSGFLVGSANIGFLETRTRSMTWEMWFWSNTVRTGQTLYSKSVLGLASGFTAQVTGTGAITGRHHGTTVVSTVTSLHNGAWHHFAFRAVRSGTNPHYLDVWVDGTMVGSISLAINSGTDFTSDQATLIGDTGLVSPTLWGSCAEVAVYEPELSAERIREHYMTGVRVRG